MNAITDLYDGYTRFFDRPPDHRVLQRRPDGNAIAFAEAPASS